MQYFIFQNLYHCFESNAQFLFITLIFKNPSNIMVICKLWTTLLKPILELTFPTFPGVHVKRKHDKKLEHRSKYKKIPFLIGSFVLRPHPRLSVIKGTNDGYSLFSKCWLQHFSLAGHTWGLHSIIKSLKNNKFYSEGLLVLFVLYCCHI